MSKLSKFKKAIPIKEGAKLLSTLIEENVDEFNLLSLYEGGWINLIRYCHAEIVRLKPIFEPETHKQHARDGRYFMEPDGPAGVAFGFYLPCDLVQVAGRHAYALRDADGGFYAIRDNQSDIFLSPYDEDHDDMKFLVLTSDIYSIAEKANSESMPDQPNSPIMINDHCVGMEKTVFNFAPNEEPNEKPEKAKLIHDDNKIKLPPSLRITVAALLEAATGERAKHTQSSLIASILERNAGIRGLSESSLQKHFSECNAELERLRRENVG